MKFQRIACVSGGKDSTALYLWLLDKGKDFRAVYADTGFESPITRDYVLSLPEKTGGPPVEVIQADMSGDVLRKRANLPRRWAEKGVSGEKIAQAQAVLLPTGNPFLDLCLSRGGFPSLKRRFCTDELKLKPFSEQVYGPLLDAGVMPVSFQGLRRAESRSRASRTTRGVTDVHGCLYRVCLPLLDWTVEDVMEIHARHDIKPNPLYAHGMERVGCWPCINTRKSGIKALSLFAPEAIDQIEQWEQIVAESTPKGQATFFMARNLRHGDEPITPAQHGIRQQVEWANTDRGGKQFPMFGQDEAEQTESDAAWQSQCSVYGVCE